MPRLRKVSGRDAIRALEHLGFSRIRQRGSHVVMKKTTEHGEIGCVIPTHRELKIGTLLGILRQAKVEVEQFLESL